MLFQETASYCLWSFYVKYTFLEAMLTHLVFLYHLLISFFSFFGVFFPSTLTKSKSSSGLPIFCVQAALGFRFESEGVMGSFGSRSEYFQNQRYTELKSFTKAHFCVLCLCIRCLKMPRILVIMIDTAEHWQFQNRISPHTLFRQSLRKLTEPKLQKYIVLEPQQKT